MDRISGQSFTDLTQEDFAAQRTATRDSLLLAAMMRHPQLAEPVKVRVRNLSAGGLMAEYPDPMEAGAPVEIEVRGVGWVSGKVAWSTDGRIGVAFEKEINPKDARKPVGQGTHTPTYVKPPLRSF